MRGAKLGERARRRVARAKFRRERRAVSPNSCVVSSEFEHERSGRTCDRAGVRRERGVDQRDSARAEYARGCERERRILRRRRYEHVHTLGARPQTNPRRSDHAEPAVRAHEQLVEVVAGDVLDDAPAGFHENAARKRNSEPEHHVARVTETRTQRRGSERAAERSGLTGWVERELPDRARELRLDFGERRAGRETRDAFVEVELGRFTQRSHIEADAPPTRSVGAGEPGAAARNQCTDTSARESAERSRACLCAARAQRRFERGAFECERGMALELRP